MIYRRVKDTKALRQGDIFRDLPFHKIDLQKLNIILGEQPKETTWIDIQEKEANAIVKLEKNFGIIFSQDCECLDQDFISLFVIENWGGLIASSPKKWADVITKQWMFPSRMYHPPDANLGFKDRMEINFGKVFYLYRIDLELFRSLRIARLNSEALEHFREKMAFYFHRYGYTTTYPLNKEELDAYERNSELKNPRRTYQK